MGTARRSNPDSVTADSILSIYFRPFSCMIRLASSAILQDSLRSTRSNLSFCHRQSGISTHLFCCLINTSDYSKFQTSARCCIRNSIVQPHKGQRSSHQYQQAEQTVHSSDTLDAEQAQSIPVGTVFTSFYCYLI